MLQKTKDKFITLRRLWPHALRAARHNEMFTERRDAGGHINTDYLPNIYIVDPTFTPNGCSYVPDRWGLCPSMAFAGDLHDYLYHQGGTANDKTRADLLFRQLMHARANECGWWRRWWANRQADLYYIGVRNGIADKHFIWKGNETCGP